MQNKKKNVKSAALIKKIAGKMADVSCGAASFWGVYQPKEPASLKKTQKILMIWKIYLETKQYDLIVYRFIF